MEKMIDIALKSGGCIKIDLKCYSESLNIALCGVSNKQPLKNFKNLGKLINKRPEVPLLIASTLLIPGYIDTNEIDLISKFISSVDPNIPYRLLCFYPHHLMTDLPTTSKSHAERCLKIAKENGLTNLSIGNVNLLSNERYNPPR
jgi:pyruvate formate lyase activating enzyme